MNEAPLHLQLGTFELDEANARVVVEGAVVPLTPRAFFVLCTLARRAGQLVTKDVLLDAVWGHRFVSESVLKTTISSLRAALGDDPKQPRFIETVSRHGYRFIAAESPEKPVTARPAAMAPLALEPDALPLVGRAEALAALHTAWHRANNGQRQMVWVAGEAGVGKTTLIDRFVSELDDAIIVHSQCMEHFGSGEPYLPVLDALNLLARQDPEAATMLRTIAPMWFLQLPWLGTGEEHKDLQRELVGGSPDRMLREIGEFIDQYTARRPLLLVMEDMHWCDHATARLADRLSRRRGPSRLMWLGSFRLAELVSDEHPLNGIRHDLRVHGLCRELILDSFSERQLAEYIGQRLEDEKSEAFVREVHARTEGLPLFVVSVLDELTREPPDTIASRSSAMANEEWGVPYSLAGMMEARASRLSSEEAAALEAASACGLQFDPASVACALSLPPDAVSDRLRALVNGKYWITLAGVEEDAEGVLQPRYAFSHALHRKFFYERSQPVVRAQRHRQLAQALERLRQRGHPPPVTEIALHFERGRDFLAAARYYGEAAHNALARFAPAEATRLVERAISLLPSGLPDDRRVELELPLYLTLGISRAQHEGMSSNSTRAAYDRARALCEQRPDSLELGWILAGLGLVQFGQGRFDLAQATAERIVALAGSFDDDALAIAGRNLGGMALHSRGEFQQGRQWLEEGVRLCESLGDALPAARYFVDPGVTMHGHLAIHLVPMGLVDEARAHAAAALARAERLAHPLARALAFRCAGLMAALRDEPLEVAARAQALDELAVAHGIPQAAGASRLLGGWAQARIGDLEAGVARLMEGLAMLQSLGMVAGTAQALCLAVDALIHAAQWQRAQLHLDEARQLAEQLQERARLPEIEALQARIHAGLRH